MNFVHIGFLAAGAAAMTLPLWIHLLLRQRARSIDIGSVRFIKQVVRRTRSRQRIKRWILLAMRSLAVLMLGLLFARPFLPDTPTDGSTREEVILIDRSASMGATHDDGQSAFQKAIEEAKSYIDSGAEQTRFHIGLFDSGGVQRVSRSDLDTAANSAMGTSYQGAFEWAVDMFDASNRADRKLLLLSDLQRSGNQGTDLSAFSADIPIRIEDPSPSISQNLAIEWALAAQVEIRPGVPVTVDVQVVNHGTFPVIDVPLRLMLEGPEGEVDHKQNISLGPGQRLPLEIELPIESAAIYRGTITIDHEDRYQWDNVRSLAFQTRHPDRLLLIDGDAGQRSWESETYFVETALRLRTPVGDGPAKTFEVERMVWDRGSGFPDLAGFRLIVIANVGRFREQDAERLQSYVRDGGNVIWFAGERSTTVVYKRLSDAGLLGKTKLGPAIDTVARTLEFDSSHAAFKPFEKPQHGDLRNLVARRVVPIEDVDPESRVLMRSRQWPLIVSHQTGEGEFVLIATSADREWNDWPQNRLFVPLVRQLAGWLTGQFDHRAGVKSEPISRADQIPGISTDGDLVMVHNVDPEESKIGRYGVEQFRKMAGLPEEAIVTHDADRRERLAPAGITRSDERWPWVIWLLLGLLGAELLLASRVHE